MLKVFKLVIYCPLLNELFQMSFERCCFQNFQILHIDSLKILKKFSIRKGARKKSANFFLSNFSG